MVLHAVQAGHQRSGFTLTHVRSDLCIWWRYSVLLRQQGRCGVKLADCCCGSRDVAASFWQTAVAAAGTLRRHTCSLLLRQQRRCGVTLEDCCCGSRDIEASFWQNAVAAAGVAVSLVDCCGQQRRCGVTVETAVAAAVWFRPGGASDSASVRLSHRSPLLSRKLGWFS